MKFSELLLNLFILRNRPVSLVHFVTNRCNARCGHCFIDFNNPDIFKRELSLSEIRDLTSKLGNSLINFNLTGGEPFLRNDVFEIAEAYFKNAGVKSIFISTNGMFTARIKEFIDRFIESKITGKIIFSVSIDNIKELHDQNRRSQGIFDNAIRTLNLISGYNAPNIICNIGITVADHNYDNVVSLYYQLRGMGFGSITATIMREEGIIKKIDVVTKGKILKAYTILTELIREGVVKGGRQRIKNSFSCILLNAKNIILNQVIRGTYLRSKYIVPCVAASLFAVIHANGDVYPCEILNNPLGNLRGFDMDFMRLWGDKGIKKNRILIRNTHCSCVYGCAWTINIISNLIFFPRLAYYCMKQI